MMPYMGQVSLWAGTSWLYGTSVAYYFFLEEEGSDSKKEASLDEVGGLPPRSPRL